MASHGTHKKKEKVLDLVYGVHPLIELLKAKRRHLQALYTTKPVPKVWSLIEPLLPPSLQINYVSREVLTRMAQTSDHQSVVGLATPFIKRSTFFNPHKSPFLILLDSVQDPRNLGAILRSAYCTGVDGVILCGKQSAPLQATALKASAGLAEHLEIYEAPTALAAVQLLKQAQYKLYLATLSGENALTALYSKPLCLIIGNEATGIAKNLLSSGTQIKLAQRTSDISYNASVAAGILLFLIADKLKVLES
jgi:23S rRNA (guanosine2251-2'-O)-methyltransferase